MDATTGPLKDRHAANKKRRAAAKSSSERGRLFRERERKLVESLQQAIAVLQKQVQEKTYLESIWQAKYLRSRHTAFGSLMKLTEEYYTVLHHGVPHDDAVTTVPVVRPPSQAMAQDPVEFLTRVTHPAAVLGDVVGPEGMVDQWRQYTAAHRRFEARVFELEVRGPEENPFIFAQLQLRGRFTRKTFEILFPKAMSNEALIQQYIGKEIVYLGTTLLRFSKEMQIICQDVQLNFIGGLLALGIPIALVSELMGQSVISPTCTIVASIGRPKS